MKCQKVEYSPSFASFCKRGNKIVNDWSDYIIKVNAITYVIEQPFAPRLRLIQHTHYDHQKSDACFGIHVSEKETDSSRKIDTRSFEECSIPFSSSFAAVNEE